MGLHGQVEEVTFRGEPGVALRNRDLEVVVLPRRGAKIASLRHRPSGREWLEQPVGDLRDAPAYGSAFTDADMFGWDEMLPTITGSSYPDGKLRGAVLPDHGEVWASPWETSTAGETMVCSTAGRALPYRVRRTMCLEDARLQLEYELSTTGSEPLWLLWAAHPQFAVDGHRTRIVLPAEVRQLLDVWPSIEPRPVQWPSPGIESASGLPTGASRKLYALPDARIGTAGLVDADGPWLRLSWQPALVPYLGIWLDNGAYARHPVIALEPATGFYDDLARAVSNQRVSRVRPEQALRWSLEVSLGMDDWP
jgi:galactose mutarotase-like enzyme